MLAVEMKTRSMKLVGFLLIFSVCMRESVVNSEGKGEKDKWKKKDVRDYTDADIERLYDQWEEDDEPLPDDELPEWKKPAPKIDVSQLDPNDPEAMLQQTKKGRTLMMFASVSGNPTERETTDISSLWQSSLFNANYETQRFVVGDDRVLFMLKDGSKSWEVKEFLVQQERCELVTIEGKDYYGKGHKSKNTANKPKKDSEKKPTKKDENDINRTKREKTEL